MRTLVDIPLQQLDELARICAEEKRSRAAVVRQAIAMYVANHKRRRTVDAFGLWGERQLDGLEYQQQIRAEW